MPDHAGSRLTKPEARGGGLAELTVRAVFVVSFVFKLSPDVVWPFVKIDRPPVSGGLAHRPSAPGPVSAFPPSPTRSLLDVPLSNTSVTIDVGRGSRRG